MARLSWRYQRLYLRCLDILVSLRRLERFLLQEEVLKLHPIVSTGNSGFAVEGSGSAVEGGGGINLGNTAACARKANIKPPG